MPYSRNNRSPRPQRSGWGEFLCYTTWCRYYNSIVRPPSFPQGGLRVLNDDGRLTDTERGDFITNEPDHEEKHRKNERHQAEKKERMAERKHSGLEIGENYLAPLLCKRRSDHFNFFIDRMVEMKTCGPGKIYRTAYTRKNGTRVSGACIRDVGRPGKGFRGPGKGIGTLRKGELAKFGYSQVAKLSIAERHAALRKAVEAYGSLSVWRKLNAVKVYTRRTASSASHLFKEDMDWIRATFGVKAKQ